LSRDGERMEIIPAIDIRDGRCVRFLQGDPNRMVVYADDPVVVAQRWLDEGAQRLHVVDLDGALLGRPVHLSVVEAIVRLGARVQVGGGFRTLADLEAGVATGAERVVLGTAARMLAPVAAARLGARLVASIDAKDGQTAVRGWTETSGDDPLRVAAALKAQGIGRFIYTDISRDGMLGGPAVAAVQAFVQAVGVPVVAAGGVATADDIIALDGAGIEGVIIGRALYEGSINLRAILTQWRSRAC